MAISTPAAKRASERAATSAAEHREYQRGDEDDGHNDEGFVNGPTAPGYRMPGDQAITEK